MGRRFTPPTVGYPAVRTLKRGAAPEAGFACPLKGDSATGGTRCSGGPPEGQDDGRCEDADRSCEELIQGHGQSGGNRPKHGRWGAATVAKIRFPWVGIAPQYDWLAGSA